MSNNNDRYQQTRKPAVLSSQAPKPIPDKANSTTLLPPSDSWLGKNTAPTLALATVFLTFWMFWYFIHIANTPNKEVRNLYLAQQKYDSAVLNLQNVNKNEPEKVLAANNDVSHSFDLVTSAKADLEESKEQRGMVKDFILYILGVLSSILTSVFNYYFGSSKSSANKDDTLHEIAKRS